MKKKNNFCFFKVALFGIEGGEGREKLLKEDVKRNWKKLLFLFFSLHKITFKF